MRWALPALALVLVLLAYLATLQLDIGGADDPSPAARTIVGPLMDDSGEFVVAWHTWGVSHAPGYPLLNLLGNLLTPVLGAIAPTPAAAAGLVSLLSTIGALSLMAALVGRSTGSARAAAVAVWLPAFGQLIWLYASVAEVYGFALLLAAGCLLVAWETGRRPTHGRAIVLGLLFGLAVGHHRTLLALAPALVAGAWPARALGRRVWLAAAALSVASLAVYAYLPLAALAGSPWVYGRSPATLAGFRDAIVAREYGDQLLPTAEPSEWPSLVLDRLRYLAAEASSAGLALGLVGLALGFSTRSARRVSVLLLLAAAAFLLAPTGQALVIGTHLLIMVATLAVAAGAGVGLAVIARRRPLLAWAWLVGALAVGALAWHSHRASVLSYSRDGEGRRLIDAVAALEGPSPTVVTLWGPRTFALAYAQLVTGEVPRIRLVNSWADLSNLPDDLPDVVYTAPDFLYLAPPPVWSARLGSEVFLESAGPDLVAVRRGPRTAPAMPGAAASSEIVLTAASARRLADGDVDVRLEWLAVRRPAVDYHVLVQVTDRDVVEGPEDIVASGDEANPVHGFAPTSSWAAGQLVRDDVRVAVPPGRTPRYVFVGLYTVGADGRFTDHLRVRVPVEAGGEAGGARPRESM